MTERKWTRTSSTSWRCEPWVIARVTVHSRERFELWHDDERGIVAVKDSFNEARDAAKRLENARAKQGEND